MSKRLPPMHPEEFCARNSWCLSSWRAARKVDVPHTRIERIAEEKTDITAGTVLRLSGALGTTSQLWLNLQIDCDLLGRRWQRSRRWPRPHRHEHVQNPGVLTRGGGHNSI